MTRFESAERQRQRNREKQRRYRERDPEGYRAYHREWMRAKRAKPAMGMDDEMRAFLAQAWLKYHPGGTNVPNLSAL